MTPKEESKGIKVTDRRMFTAEGELREPENGERAVDTDETSAASTGGEVSGASAEREPLAEETLGELPRPGFADLVAVLAEPIGLFLGDAQLPDGTSAANLDLARFHIDLLDVLKGKTEGNLSQDERALLEDLLYRLRMRYVQKSR